MPGNLPTTYPDPLGPLPRVRVGGKHEEIRVDSTTGLQFRRLPFRPFDRLCPPHSGKVGRLAGEATFHQEQELLHSETVHVSDRPSLGDRETGMVWSPSHEAHTVASEASLAHTRGSGKGHSSSPHSPSTSGQVVRGEQCSSRPTFSSPPPCPSAVYRRLKRRLGRTFRGLHYKRRLVRHRKSSSHQPLGVKGSFSGFKELRASLQESDCSHSNGQHDCGILHQQTGRYEIRLSVCPLLETTVMVSPQRDNLAGSTHPRSPQHDSGQVVQTRSGDSDRVVPFSTGFQSLVLQMGPASGRPVCNPVQSQASQVCFSGARPGSLGSGRVESVVGESERLCLSSNLFAQPSNLKGDESRVLQDDPNCSGMAQHALVLGPGRSINTGSPETSVTEGSCTTAFQRSSSQESQQSESACLAPRASVIQEQGFSNEVAARIEAPQRVSTRAVYKSKWAIFVRWSESNKVDVRSPSIVQIADFLLHLFKERNLQPSTIEGYRTAIADMVGNEKLNISKDENLTRLIDSFHRDKPKRRRGVPPWNLSLVLHQLTKAPFEPMRKASLKHLTFKAVFLLALGSGKRRSEIHTWLYRNIRHQENWSQVSLYPSPSFLSKNQLARDGPTSVVPVVIPALVPSLDRSLRVTLPSALLLG